MSDEIREMDRRWRLDWAVAGELERRSVEPFDACLRAVRRLGADNLIASLKVQPGEKPRA